MDFRWSDTVDDYYAVSPRPRWGYDRPPHEEISRVIDRRRGVYDGFLDELIRNREALYAVPRSPQAGRLGPYWDNAWFSCLDAAALVGFILTRRPQRYIEIGSGYSTLFARHAIGWGGLDTRLLSIDPHPRAEIDRICDEVVRAPLEECPLELFGELAAGDILFFDGSHRVFANSDTTALFFDILPRLKPGVLVHLHDIFLPSDYPAAWNRRMYSEQYLLGAMLLCGAPPFRVVMPAYFTSMDEVLGAKVRGLFEARPGGAIPFLYENDARIPGVSFWVEMV